jgi:UDP-N-acetylmuramyl pentapeptide phosphotransferase/UDP-N-acetylglucosamine-1-phosphate transferase
MSRFARGRATALLAGALAGAAVRLAYPALRARPPGGGNLWARTNHRGETLTLLEGPAYVAGAAAAVVLAPGLPVASRVAGLVALTGAGGFGAVDDLRESGDRKGLRGHLTELAHGRITTGGLKVIGIGTTGLLAAALSRQGAGKALLSGAVIASAANLVNLLDLRPGRALKVVLLTGAPMALGTRSASTAILGGAAAGAAAGLLPEDLAEQAMLGDTGANAAGALLGVAAVHRLGPKGQAALLTLLAGLTLISERVSFTAVIESTPGLREFDALGRRPAR